MLKHICSKLLLSPPPNDCLRLRIELLAPGCLQLLEILEILNFIDAAEKFKILSAKNL